jgi:hypothetical protein
MPNDGIPSPRNQPSTHGRKDTRYSSWPLTPVVTKLVTGVEKDLTHVGSDREKLL